MIFLNTIKTIDLWTEQNENHIECFSGEKYIYGFKNRCFPCDSGQHLIKLEGYDNTFNDEWEQKFEIEGFNLKIEGGLWISDIGSFYTFNEAEFCGEAISFKTGDGDIQYSDFKYDVPAGKYLLSVKGFLRKEKKGFPNPNSGFLFSLVKVDEFSGFKNPREDIYNFNVTNM